VKAGIHAALTKRGVNRTIGDSALQTSFARVIQTCETELSILPILVREGSSIETTAEKTPQTFRKAARH
jgi:hypothetical protein